MKPFFVLGNDKLSLSFGWFNGMHFNLLKVNVFALEGDMTTFFELQIFKFIIHLVYIRGT